MENELAALSAELSGAVERAAPAVVAVNARPRLVSSGVIWRPGIIVTAEHTIRRREEIGVTLPDGRATSATLAGRDAGTDLAVLKLSENGTAAATFGSPETLKPGQIVLAIGRSPDSGVNATMGIMSAVGGPWRSWRGGQIDQYLRLDLTLYPGSSGGAVVDTEGRVLGISTSALSRIAGLAVPVSTVNRVIDELLRTGHVARGYLGLGLHPVALPDGSTGLIVLSSEAEGPAARAGVLIGDILVALAGQPVAGTDDIQTALGSESVGKAVAARIVRGGQAIEINITIGERPRRETEMSRAFGEIAERLRRSTVEVCLSAGRAGGSGVIATADGQIVTNAHVARGTRATIRLWDGREFPGELQARDARRDLAMFQVQARGLPAATFGDSNALRVGELVLAIGNPLGFTGALTTGVVHALGRLEGFGRQNWVMADVRLAPGNSGGPLADANGRVMGINTMIVNGLGAAVPGNAVSAFLRRGVAGFSLGVTVEPVRLEDGRFGLLILKVEAGSRAAAAPLWTGDILTGVEGRAFRSVDDLHQALDDTAGVMHLQFVRGDRTVRREAVIRLMEGRPGRAAEAA